MDKHEIQLHNCLYVYKTKNSPSPETASTKISRGWGFGAKTIRQNNPSQNSFSRTPIISIEIKSAETVNSDFFSNLVKWNQLSANPSENSYVIYGGKGVQTRTQGTALGWSEVGQMFTKLR